MAQVNGMKVKLAEFKAFRAMYQNLRMMYSLEMQYADVAHAWAEKLERCMKVIAEDTTGDAFDLRKYALRVIESKPKSMLG